MNLKADPTVEVQVKGDRFKAQARDATPEEKPEMWQTMTKEWPQYDANPVPFTQLRLPASGTV